MVKPITNNEKASVNGEVESPLYLLKIDSYDRAYNVRMKAVTNPVIEMDSVSTGFFIIPTNKPTSPVIKITINASILFNKV
jgi:hypothetical protein